jgi:pSer/pThr/pTyr-binding forkhead associated (FHA) protein
MIDVPQLAMTKGPQPGQVFRLDQELLTLGRDPGNDIVINDPQVSRRHARIRRREDLTVIEDVGSTNGTFVNGLRLTGPHTLFNADVISLGDAVKLTYRGVGEAATAPLGEHPTVRPASLGHEPEPAPAPEYAAAPPDVQIEAEEPVEKRPSRTWLWVGCGCLALLFVAIILGMFVLDALRLLPAVFYEPLRWLGLI